MACIKTPSAERECAVPHTSWRGNFGLPGCSETAGTRRSACPLQAPWWPDATPCRKCAERHTSVLPRVLFGALRETECLDQKAPNQRRVKNDKVPRTPTRL
eukprot:7394435-Alexandrium_andersonii.AAC.1